MKRILVVSVLFLAGCALPPGVPQTGSGALREIIHTASGYVIEAGKQAAATIELGKMGMEKAKETAEDFKKRAGEVKEGIESIQKGKEMVEKGLRK